MIKKTTQAISQAVTQAWQEFLRLETAAGLLLVFAATTAMLLANSPLADFYTGILDLKLTVTIESFGVSKPLLLWINDGLMAIFFLLFGTVSAGIVLGLLLGKQVGVFGFSALAIGLGIAKKPPGASWAMLYGVALICGVGFTMSLFIGSLAFEHGDFSQDAAVKFGVIVGSLASAFCGWLVLHLSLPKDL